MKKFLTVILFCSLLISIVKAQKSKIDSFPNRSAINEMRLRVADQMPKGYEMEFGWEILRDSKHTNDSMDMWQRRVEVAITSRDGDFRVLCRLPYVMTARDSINLQHQKLHPDITLSLNYSHMRTIIDDLMASQFLYRPVKDSAHYYTFAESRRLFNADTVITYAMNMNNIYKGGVFQDKYTHQQVYVIQRRDRGFFALYCFTTDKGQRDFKKHFRALQQIFRYKHLPPPNHGKIPRDSILRKAMKISVSRYKPYTFNQDWYTSPSPSRIMNNLSVTSTDSNFVAVCEALELFTRKDSACWVEYTFNASGETIHVSPDYSHIIAIERCLRINQGNDCCLIHDSAYFHYTHKEAREMFNADSVIRIPLDFNKTYRGYFTADPVHPSFRNRGFNHVEAYVITRKGRGYVIFYCLTTDKGQRDFKKHFRALQQIFRYEDD